MSWVYKFPINHQIINTCLNSQNILPKQVIFVFLFKFMMRKTYLFFLLFTSMLVVQSCKKDEEDPPEDSTDMDLYNAISSVSGYTYYIGTPGITAAAGNSPHGFERVRFNATAQAALDSTGKLPVGSTFLAGSIIVKEIYSSATGGLSLYAVMKKDASNSNVANGYVWAEYNTNGTVAYSASNKGAGCVSCHSGSTNRDLVRTFDLH